MKSGAVEPDGVLDLHGMTLDAAWRAIDRALERSIDAGNRVLLLITGHPRPGDPPVERGRIRAAVHDCSRCRAMPGILPPFEARIGAMAAAGVSTSSFDGRSAVNPLRSILS